MLTGLLVVCAALAASPAGAGAEWQRGVNFNTYKPAVYASPASDASLRRAAADGNDSIELLVTWYSPNPYSNDIAPDPARTPTDASLLHAMRTARSLGLHVALKPVVDIYTGTWRGEIHPLDPAAWFGNYQSFVDHYATLAQQGGASMFLVGTELETMTVPAYTPRWQNIIAGVRARFGGKLTYGANFDEYEQIGFWSSLDYLGVDAYFALAGGAQPDVSELLYAWTSKGYIASLAKASAITGKPVLFTEIGYRSIAGGAAHPNWWSNGGPVDLTAQVNAYEAAYEAFVGRPWFAGMYWWNWPAALPGSGSSNDYPSYLKPAETVMSSWNASLAPPLRIASKLLP